MANEPFPHVTPRGAGAQYGLAARLDIHRLVLFHDSDAYPTGTTEGGIPYTARYRTGELAKKSATTYIYIGRPVKGQGHSDGSSMRIQLNDKYGDIDDIAEYIAKERSRMAPEDAANMTVSIMADRDTPMGVIEDVKRALRSAHALKVVISQYRRKTLIFIAILIFLLIVLFDMSNFYCIFVPQKK